MKINRSSKKLGHTEVNASTKKRQRFNVSTTKLSQCTISLRHIFLLALF